MSAGEEKHERSDVALRTLALVAAGIFGALALVLAAVGTFFDDSSREYRSVEEVLRRGSPDLEVAKKFPPPLLQANPRKELREWRAEELKVLESYRWVDKARGVARVPIDVAKEMVVRGEE